MGSILRNGRTSSRSLDTPSPEPVGGRNINNHHDVIEQDFRPSSQKSVEKLIPPQISDTLERIVGQLNILTQVRNPWVYWMSLNIYINII